MAKEHKQVSSEMSDFDAVMKLAQETATLVFGNLTRTVRKYPLTSLFSAVALGGAVAVESSNSPTVTIIGFVVSIGGIHGASASLGYEALFRDRLGVTPRTVLQSIQEKWHAYRRGEITILPANSDQDSWALPK